MVLRVLLSALALTSLRLSVEAMFAKAGHFTLGAIKLDNMTFDKVINTKDHKFLVRIQAPWTDPETDDGKAFKTLCEMAVSTEKFLIAEMPVSPPNVNVWENYDMFERFNVIPDELPYFYLYTDENKQAVNGPNNGMAYHGAIDPDIMKLWLMKNGVAMPIDSTIADLDKIAKKFMKDLADSKKADATIAEAKHVAESLYGGNTKAQMYLKIMDKIKTKGQGYIADETARVKKMTESKQPEQNLKKLKEKLGVLAVFASGIKASGGKSGKQEL